MYYIADRETGTFIEPVETIDQGIEVILSYEKRDKIEGIYEPGFYTVVDEDHCEADKT